MSGARVIPKRKKTVTYRRYCGFMWDGWEYEIKEPGLYVSSGPFKTKKLAMQDYARAKKLYEV